MQGMSISKVVSTAVTRKGTAVGSTHIILKNAWAGEFVGSS